MGPELVLGGPRTGPFCEKRGPQTACPMNAVESASVCIFGFWVFAMSIFFGVVSCTQPQKKYKTETWKNIQISWTSIMTKGQQTKHANFIMGSNTCTEENVRFHQAMAQLKLFYVLNSWIACPNGSTKRRLSWDACRRMRYSRRAMNILKHVGNHYKHKTACL